MKLTPLLIFTSLIALSGCSSNMVFKTDLKETPKPSHTNMTSAVQCMGSKLGSAKPNQAFVFLVREVNDGTVKRSPYQNSPLSDAGRIQLMNMLSTYTFPHVGLVTDTFPFMFKQLSKEAVGLNRLGLPSQQNMRAFNKTFGGIINNARRAKKIPPTTDIVPLVISGSFSRFDTDSLKQLGWGQNAGTRARGNDAEDRSKGSGEVDFGKTSSARAMTLVVNLIDPRNNLVVGSQSFDIMFYRKNKNFRLRFAINDGFYGVSKNNVEVEGVHSAQKTLIDAAALWILNKAYGAQTKFDGCFKPEQQPLLK